jgi:serine/threonine protein kinase
MTREDLELYVSGNFDGDTTALETEIAGSPALAEAIADEARFEMLLRDAATAATFCAACDDVVRTDRCDACGAAVHPGGYTIERVLVSNAHGRMYVAHDADGKQVALKELAFVQAPSPTAIDAFEREAKFLRALEHPAIPRFVASFEEGRGIHARYYLAQELVEGTALDHLEQKWYREDEIVDIARQALGVLVYLQSLSPMIIHRDIKPANLVRRADGTIALVDFGAAYIDGTRTGVTTAVGTFGYMPVEQHAGIVDATTDLYALGASLLYLLTRQEPWRLAQEQTVVNVSAPLRGYLNKLTATDPRKRFATAQEALTMLDRREELVKQVVTTRPHKRAVLAIVAAAGILAGGLTVGLVAHKPDAVVERPAPAIAAMATLHVQMPQKGMAVLSIDDAVIGNAEDGLDFPVTPGIRRVKIANGAGGVCDQRMQLEPGKTTVVECVFTLPKVEPGPRLASKQLVSWSYKSAPLQGVLAMAAKGCGFNVVLPDNIQTKVNAQLAQAPCDQAIESILEAEGLWYDYEPTTRLLRVAPRRQIDQERAEAVSRPPSNYPRLPTSTQLVDLDFKDVPLHDLTAMLTAGAGKMNFVFPDNIQAKTSVSLKGVPWERAFEAVLESHGLWYRYREDGKIVRIAPRRQLEQEEAEER